jgi:uncharacterized protein YdaU (DUF1376 family)
MHFYKFHVGDYRKKTHHLTLLEHGIYRSLLDTYYLTENPLDGDTGKLMRSHGVRAPEEIQAFKNVLDDFFYLKDNEFHHDSCNEQLNKIYEKSEKARQSAKARWLNKCETDTNGMRNQCERIESKCESIVSDCVEDATHNPLPITHNKEEKPSASVCPHEKIIDLYHEILPELKSVIISRWSGSQREKDLRSRWREHPNHQEIDFWRWLFNSIKTSDWHMGRSGSWSADLGWLVKRSNFDKMVERAINIQGGAK